MSVYVSEKAKIAAGVPDHAQLLVISYTTLSCRPSPLESRLYFPAGSHLILI